MLRTYVVKRSFPRKKNQDLTTLMMYRNAFNKSKFRVYSICAHSETSNRLIQKPWAQAKMYSTNSVQLLQWLHGKQQQRDTSEWEDLGSDLSLGDNDGREVNSGSGGKFCG